MKPLPSSRIMARFIKECLRAPRHKCGVPMRSVRVAFDAWGALNGERAKFRRPTAREFAALLRTQGLVTYRGHSNTTCIHGMELKCGAHEALVFFY